MLVRINLNTKEKVCRFLDIPSIPYEGAGFSVTEKNGKFFIKGDNFASVGVIHTLIEVAFMKSGCPHVLKSGKPVVQAKKELFNDKDLLKLLGYEDYTDKTVAFFKRRKINPFFEEQLEKALACSKLYKPKLWNKAYDVACVTKSRRLYKKLMEIKREYFQ